MFNQDKQIAKRFSKRLKQLCFQKTTNIDFKEFFVLEEEIYFSILKQLTKLVPGLWYL